MELKKNPKADLVSKKEIFLLIGLILALSASILAYESKSYDKQDVGLGDLKMNDLDEEDIDITRPEEEPPPPEKELPSPPEVPEEIEIVDKEELENELKVDDAETDEDDYSGSDFEEEFEEIFISVEQMPTLGDCKDIADKVKADECTQREVMKFISRNFKYPEIAKANGVEGRVVLTFVVWKDGKVRDIEILKGIDKHIDKACIKVIEDLPVFLPGRQIGKAVPVRYTVPIKCTLG